MALCLASAASSRPALLGAVTRGSPADAGSPLAEICRRVATPEVARAVTAFAAFLTCDQIPLHHNSSFPHYPMSVPSKSLQFCRRALDQRSDFWAEQAQAIYWQKPFTEVCSFDRPPFVQWFKGGETNLCYNAVDRHLGPGEISLPSTICRQRSRPRNHTLTVSSIGKSARSPRYSNRSGCSVAIELSFTFR
jgi:Acetyl-coenzyme A synthetase N-terminus